MSDTYRYPRESLEDAVSRDEFDADLRIQKRLKQKKEAKKRGLKADRAMKKFISFRDRNRAKIR